MGFFDLTIFVLMLFRTFTWNGGGTGEGRTTEMAQELRGIRLVQVLVRDGSVYFGCVKLPWLWQWDSFLNRVILLSNVANISTFVVSNTT